MQGRTLFWQRFREEATFQRNVIRTVIDWVIAFYTVVPVLILAPFIYYEMWQRIDLYWNPDIPISLFIGVMLILLYSGNFRTFLKEADVLFLLRHSKLLSSLKLWSFYYSLLKLVLPTVLLVVLAMPILQLAYGWSNKDVYCLILILIAYRLVLWTMKKLSERTLYKASGVTILFIGTIYFTVQINSGLFASVSVAVIAGICLLNFKLFVKRKTYFYRELAIERSERLRYIKLILNFSTEIETPPASSRKPLSLRRPKTLFQKQSPADGLLELLVKAFWRDKLLLGSYFRIIGVFSFVIIGAPVWLKFVAFILLLLFLRSWLKSAFDRLLDHTFFDVVPYEKEVVPFVRPRFQNRLIGWPLIFSGMLGLLTGLFI